ncbi:hypothetical protein DFH09DRAFT_1091287 [Mycena vulgaris]|nr:hypothetical protein DFH09DRAFT_1091287 [Mycena vulgaris]
MLNLVALKGIFWVVAEEGSTEEQLWICMRSAREGGKNKAKGVEAGDICRQIPVPPSTTISRIAQLDLNTRIKMRLEPIYAFLRAARRTEAEQFNFPYTDQQLLQSLATVRHALDAVEDMVRGNTDLDVTEPETELGDSDATRVECKPDF